MSQQVFREHPLSLRIRHDSRPWRSVRTYTNTFEIKSQHKTIQLFKTAWWDKARKATMLHVACQPHQLAWLPAAVLRIVRPRQKLNEECPPKGRGGICCGYANIHRSPEREFGGGLPPIRIVLDSLRVYFTTAHILHCQWQSFSIFNFSISHCFQVGLLDFWMFGPNYLSIGIHGHGRFLPTKLEEWQMTLSNEKENKLKPRQNKHFLFSFNGGLLSSTLNLRCLISWA